MTKKTHFSDNFEKFATLLDYFLLCVDILEKYTLLMNKTEREMFLKEREYLEKDVGFDSGEIPPSYLDLWLLLDFEFGEDEKTVAEKFIDSNIMKDISNGQNTDATAYAFFSTAMSYFAFYEVISFTSDKMTLFELGTSNLWKVNKTGQPFEKDIEIGDICYTRLAGVREEAFFLAEPTFFPNEAKESILKEISSQKNFWKKETGSYEEKQDFRQICKLFHPIWVRNIFAAEAQEVAATKNQMPILLNTDKELLRITTLEFAIKNPGAFEKAIEKTGKFSFDERENLWIWSKKKTKHSGTILGTLKICDGILTAETNSAERAKRLRKILEKEAGEHISFKKITVKDPNEILPSSEEEIKKFDEEQQALMSKPEIREVLEKHQQEYYLNSWVRQKIPALGNKTPFQALKTKKGRRKLTKLIDHMEKMSEKIPSGKLMDFNLLRKKLGLPIKK